MSHATNIPIDRLEFHRHGLALVPGPGDEAGGVAVLISGKDRPDADRFCSCSAARKKTCPHLLEISRIARVLSGDAGKPQLDDDFRNGHWFALGAILADGDKETPNSIQIQKRGVANGEIIRVIGSQGREVVALHPRKQSIRRLLERCGNRPADPADPENDRRDHRGVVLKRLARLTMSENERIMAMRGFRSRVQGLEESFWYFFVYHHFREYGDSVRFRVEMDASSGDLMLSGEVGDGPVFNTRIPRRRVKAILEWSGRFLPGADSPSLHSASLRPVFRVRLTEARDLEVVPLFELAGTGGEASVYYPEEVIEGIRYGDLAYLDDLKAFVRVESIDRELRSRWTQKIVVKRDRVPAFLDQFKSTMAQGPYVIDPSVAKLKIFKVFDRSTINPEAIKRDWCWLSVDYGFGKNSLSLASILKAKKKKQRFVETPDGWVDVQSDALEGLNGLLDLSESETEDGGVGVLKLNRMEVFRVHAAHDTPPEITGEKNRAEILRGMLGLRAARPLPESAGLKSRLRGYQQNGVEWAWFLYDNRLGGILCDDMGLGKTHQSMALMLSIAADEKMTVPFLVVCPTTVLSHWQRKIEMFAPDLKASVYHGPGRDFDQARRDSRVILTSYGLLRRDIEHLGAVRYPLVIFDEIQHIKNAGTQAYGAAAALEAGVKLGLTTGTPIENSLTDIKALMDLAMPGYLGADSVFKSRYVVPLKTDLSGPRQHEFRRLISPFTLRRLKESVLPELPEKIEDNRFCKLRGEQVQLYREAVSSQGQTLLTALKDGESKVPYIHIFALLNLLKQICDHPALLDESVDRYRDYRSGKWELFKELLGEAVDSGQKVVVYSQFLGMIRIIADHLKSLDVGFVTLTGASRKRGEIIARFNEDPACRVYVGSLKAGGTGVDLVAGSVVIHYDRWWNAAKEDQATDRVHRIGQKRGVQVFKLVTQGTLEEKIAAIIEKKRNLMDAVIREDDPGLLKSFSREELIEILSIPMAEDDDEAMAANGDELQ
jgi:superfamily II DNA or RNA helicase